MGSGDRIDTKKEFYDRYYSGNLCVNKPKIWRTVREIKDDRWKGKVCIRVGGKNGRSNVRYDIPLSCLEREVKNLRQKGFSERDIVFNQSMNNENLIIQGELQRNEEGLWML